MKVICIRGNRMAEKESKPKRKAKKKRRIGKEPLNKKTSPSIPTSKHDQTTNTQDVQESRKKLFWRIAAIAGALVAIAGLVAIPVKIYKWVLSHTPPKLSVMYFYREDRVELPDVMIEPSMADVNEGILRIPVNLAVHNKEKKRLDPTSIVLSYPADVNVSSSGKARIGPSRKQWIYEHRIDSIEPGPGYTPVITEEIRVKSDMMRFRFSS